MYYLDLEEKEVSKCFSEVQPLLVLRDAAVRAGRVLPCTTNRHRMTDLSISTMAVHLRVCGNTLCKQHSYKSADAV